MTEHNIYILAIISLTATIVLGVLGEFYRSASLIFTVLLSLIGVVSGFLISQHFDKKAEKQNLGKIASSGHRLTLDIYDSLKEIKEKIEKTRDQNSKNKYSKEEYNGLLDSVAVQLSILQRFSLAANNQWKDVLPPEQLSEVDNRQQKISLTGDTEVSITDKELVIKDLENKHRQTISLSGNTEVHITKKELIIKDKDFNKNIVQ